MKFIITVLAGFLVMGFPACNEREDDTPETSRSAFVMPDSLWYRGFVLDSQQLADEPRLLDNANLVTKLILKFSIDDIHGDSLELGGYLYPARGQTHYGRAEDPPIPLKLSDTCYRKLRSKLIIGNNHIVWRDPGGTGWREILTENVMGTRRVRANIGFLLLIPDDLTGPNCAVCDKHLHYRIELYDKAGNKVPVAGAGIGDSNPSPPADPGN